MNTLVQDGPKISSIGQVIDRWITRASPWAMAALLGVACFWALEPQPETRIEISQTYYASPGGYVPMHVPLNIVNKTHRRAVYSMYLTDMNGRTVYQYPEYTDVADNGLSLEYMNVPVPKQLKAGTYAVRATMLYKFNPFKNGVVDTRLGFIG